MLMRAGSYLAEPCRLDSGAKTPVRDGVATSEFFWKRFRGGNVVSKLCTSSVESQSEPLTHEQRRLLLVASLRTFVFRLQHGGRVRREELMRTAELAECEVTR
jgi:hypothetical protein